MNTAAPVSLPTLAAPRRLGVFERYLSLWVGLCMVVGVAPGRAAPGLMDALRKLEFAQGRQINIPSSS